MELREIPGRPRRPRAGSFRPRRDSRRSRAGGCDRGGARPTRVSLAQDDGVAASGRAESAGSLSTALVALIACQVGLHGCVQGVRMAAPLQALQQGHGAWVVGVVMALFALFPAMLAIPAGRMADRYGYHRPVRIAAGLSLAGALGAAASGHLAALCAAAALCGAGSGVGRNSIHWPADR